MNLIVRFVSQNTWIFLFLQRIIVHRYGNSRASICPTPTSCQVSEQNLISQNTKLCLLLCFIFYQQFFILLMTGNFSIHAIHSKLTESISMIFNILGARLSLQTTPISNLTLYIIIMRPDHFKYLYDETVKSHP